MDSVKSSTDSCYDFNKAASITIAALTSLSILIISGMISFSEIGSDIISFTAEKIGLKEISNIKIICIKVVMALTPFLLSVAIISPIVICINCKSSCTKKNPSKENDIRDPEKIDISSPEYLKEIKKDMEEIPSIGRNITLKAHILRLLKRKKLPENSINAFFYLMKYFEGIEKQKIIETLQEIELEEPPSTFKILMLIIFLRLMNQTSVIHLYQNFQQLYLESTETIPLGVLSIQIEEGEQSIDKESLFQDFKKLIEINFEKEVSLLKETPLDQLQSAKDYIIKRATENLSSGEIE